MTNNMEVVFMNNNDIASLGQQVIMNTYGRLPMVLIKGEGCRVWDAEGKSYLDFVAGLAVNSLGHCHPKVVNAIQEQAGKLIHCSNLYWIGPQVNLAKLLTQHSCFNKVFFANSGAEANEGAIKLARKYSKMKFGEERCEIITMTRSFHGRTLATLTATGQEKYQQGFAPLPAGFRYAPFNDLEALEQMITEKTCAIMLEPVQGEGGVNVAKRDYLIGIKNLCLDRNLLLIFDEIQCGMGRTGQLFAYEHYGVEPNIMTLAKALAGGFPIGALLAKNEVASAFVPGDHGSTFGGNPLACAAGVAALTAIIDEALPKQAEATGAYFRSRLQDLARKFDFIKDVRGLGLMIGVDLDIDVKQVADECLKNGLLINCIGSNTLRFLPPLVVTTAEVDEAIDILTKVFKGKM
jgi:acetylornithine/N-succinyldiaminopimelate aminotransferase